MNFTENDFTIYPKFKHNLWTNYEDNPEATYLTLSHGSFEVPVQEANNFLKIRSWCTGYHDKASIANKSNIPEADVKLMIESLVEIGAVHLPFKDIATLNKEAIRNTLKSAIELWSEQLADTDITVDIFLGKTSKNVVIGWLLETYHYVKSFPDALQVACDHAKGPLKELLAEYTRQEKCHEQYIVKCLLKAGISKAEIESSIPLVSTRTIELLLKELFSYEPGAVLLIAGIIEAEYFDRADTLEIAHTMCQKHGFPMDFLDSFLEEKNYC